ncbi:hypothetical protein [Acidovorax sp. SUPP2825]|uniref:hypothetical protein n=1 Tax=Acidovorax sp. SUPP2825 TaxID=2920879 RepID=UPI0023DE3B0C|nr:hypothetical protein [Acidovorax sp. SUPP2825]GKS97200.1 hypothetical protein AVAK2825_21715 [Acidovorax sp. SUPP2825]
MTLRTSKAFQVEHRRLAEKEAPTLVLRHVRSANKVELHGGVLEAQFEDERGYLVISTEGNPQEEALFIHWLNPALQIKDSLEISADYTPGIFKNPQIAPEAQAVGFSFFDDGKRWLVTVLQTPRWLRHEYPVKRKTPFWNRSWLMVRNGLDDQSLGDFSSR